MPRSSGSRDTISVLVSPYLAYDGTFVRPEIGEKVGYYLTFQTALEPDNSQLVNQLLVDVDLLSGPRASTRLNLTSFVMRLRGHRLFAHYEGAVPLKGKTQLVGELWVTEPVGVPLDMEATIGFVSRLRVVTGRTQADTSVPVHRYSLMDLGDYKQGWPVAYRDIASLPGDATGSLLIDLVFVRLNE